MSKKKFKTTKKLISGAIKSLRSKKTKKAVKTAGRATRRFVDNMEEGLNKTMGY